MIRFDGERSPAFKLVLAIVVGLVLTIPLFSVWLLVYDRQTQSNEATQSITAGWGGPQVMAGPVLVIPYRATATETVVQNGQSVTRSNEIMREFTLAPEVIELTTQISPELRKRSIYEAVVYDAKTSGRARFAFPPDLARTGVEVSKMDLSRAELRFGLSDPRGLGANPGVAVGGWPLRLQPGGGSGGGRGFFAWFDASGLPAAPVDVEFNYDFRGNASLTLVPDAGDTSWTVRSPWPHPSFAGDFLPTDRQVDDKGFVATYRIGNLSLGRSLASTADAGAPATVDRVDAPSRTPSPTMVVNDGSASFQTAAISLIQPVDPYSQVNRATKYGFLFIGFTFLTLLMFDVIGGVRVSAVEYLLMGAALILFFVLLLAFAEVIGFTPAYVVASVAIAGLNTAYSAAVLGSWRRAWFVGGLLVGLYAVLYILLSLEAFSLLIGSLLLFAALAGVMYATRRIDWSGRTEQAVD
ncbi:MAG TPA: cell envelope integrity protein CreD [Sphingomicrobium sp.]|nr:cell envelope integrity protein CreD [Sphingomicrobium sp.]